MTRPSAKLAPAQQSRAEESRRLLLEAALDCFAEFGVAATNTTMISERAGLSRGAYLHHFKSREMLIAAAIDYTQQKAMEAIESGIRGLFVDPQDSVFVDIWKHALPDTFLAGYEMMLLARFNPTLKAEWQYHSDLFRAKRADILTELFGKQVAEADALPLLEGIADFYRGLKIMELVRTEAETLRTIEAMAPLFQAKLKALQSKLLRS